MINKFASRIRELRLENKISQVELGLKLGLGRTAVSSWEAKGKEPSFDTLIKLAKIFNVSTDYLLGVSDY